MSGPAPGVAGGGGGGGPRRSRRGASATVGRAALALSGLAALLLAGAAGLVYAVDPSDVLGRNWTGVYAADEQRAKPMLMRAGSYDTVLIGSSTVTYVDPGRLCVPGVFNAAFPGAVPEEMLEFLRKYLADGQGVVLGLDLFMLNERGEPLEGEGAFPANTPGRVLGYLLDWRSVDRAARTLLRHWRGDEPFLGASGGRTAAAQLARHDRMEAHDHAAALGYFMPRLYGGFVFSEERLRVLRELKAFLEGRGAPYRVFVNPIGETTLALLRADPAWPELDRFRREALAIFPGLVDLSESRYSAVENFFRFDPLHYLPEAGASFMNEAVLKDRCGADHARASAPPEPGPAGASRTAGRDDRL